MKIDCQTAQELIPAFLLDTLDADEQVALLDHLSDCAACRAEEASLRPALGALGWAAPDAGEPAPRVKQRVLTTVHETAKPRTAAPTQRRRAFTWRWAAVLVPAALALIVIIGLGGTVSSLQTQIAQQQARLDRLTRVQTALQQFMLSQNVQKVPVKVVEAATSATATLYVTDNAVAMSVTGLPRLEGESVYQCWWRNPQTGEMVAGSSFKVDADGAGVWAWPIPEGGEYRQMTITQESRPGQTKSTGPVMLTVDL